MTEFCYHYPVHRKRKAMSYRSFGPQLEKRVCRTCGATVEVVR